VTLDEHRAGSERSKTVPTTFNFASQSARSVTAALLPVLLGIALSLTLRGYNFGGGNHTVYLIAPLQKVHPELLKNDWWTTHTLQYHVAYTTLTAALMRLGIVEPVFLILYLALVVLLHVAWLRLVLTLGLSARHYLLSVLLYCLGAGGTGLGSYLFLQDNSFLPGNVANVALLWAIVFWVEQRTWRAGACFAVAGLFHLNHALITLAFWPTATAFAYFRHRRLPSILHLPSSILAFLLILLLALPNLIPAAKLTLAHLPKLPLSEFVNLYVHLRHPHHYDPLSWPLALWLSFLWPMPLAILAYRRAIHSEPGTRNSELHNTAFSFCFFSALLLIAFLFAGVIYISEPLIQMSLFRFSIYPKLLSCVGAAAFLLDPQLLARRFIRVALFALPIVALLALLALHLLRPGTTADRFVQFNLPALLCFIALLAAGVLHVCIDRPAPARHPHFVLPFALCLLPSLLVLFALYHNWLGLRVALDDDSEAPYRELCVWTREHTPIDAVFLVPPNEQLFRYHAQRAIVVNFKCVPQLSSEMPEWKARLEAILDEPLSALPRRFDLTHAAIAARYDALPPRHLVDVARHYHARYVVTAKPLPGLKAVFENTSYHLYDLAP
jgi:hypothetical protein